MISVKTNTNKKRGRNMFGHYLDTKLDSSVCSEKENLLNCLGLQFRQAWADFKTAI